MSSPYFPILFSAAAFIVLWSLALLLLRVFNKQWWSITGVRKVRRALPVAGLGVLVIWTAGTAADWRWLHSFGSGITAALLTLLLAAVIGLTASGIVLTAERILGRVRGRRFVEVATPAGVVLALPDSPAVLPQNEKHQVARVDRSRRSFVTKAAGAVPAATIAAAGYGLLRSQGAVRMPEVPLEFSSLPQALDGYRILHLSDIHLGAYVGLDDLESVLDSASSLNADLIIVSGDLADDLRMLPDALRMMAALKPRDGIFATLGNHEYFHGVRNAVRVFDAGPVPLLRSTGAALRTGSTTIYVGGADDPVSMGQRERNHRFLQQSVDDAFNGAPSDAFHLLVSHRPEGFDVAREQGIALTISGHTHGAQIGFNGRSLLEPFYPQRYLWGHYQRGEQQLYTSAGVGHWFPFRLGCPPEAPLYVLRKA